ncbi:hypothetical protein VNO77_04300 [Canavalia gladiata]|uniref:Uncharacterized protein n=1 Tax=Canavalia gladiata TaxID=3824 RepID=A0AAN9R8Y0_CANGL
MFPFEKAPVLDTWSTVGLAGPHMLETIVEENTHGKKISPFRSQPLLFSGDVEAFHVLRFTSSLRPVWGTFWVWDVKMDKDYDEVDEVNKQLDQMGYNIGIHLIDEFLAKSYVSRYVDFKETADVIAKVVQIVSLIALAFGG